MFDRDRVAELDAGAVLSAVAERRAEARRAEADTLVLAAHFADLHPVPVGGQAAGWGEAAMVGERLLPLAGEGTPAVGEFAPVELAAALGLSADAGRALVAEALELRHRLPRLWARLLVGSVPAWLARRVAAQTPGLSVAAAAFVDRHLAATRRVLSVATVRDLVHEALLQHDPDAAEAVEQAALDRRGVELDHRESTATTHIEIICDTPDALAFETTVADVAGCLGRLGDTTGVDVRRARAVGVLANPQRSLDLLAAPAHHRDGTTSTQPGSGLLRRPTTTLYLHIGLADLATHTMREDPGVRATAGARRVDDGRRGAGQAPEGAVGRVERLGSASLDLLRDWLGRLDPGQLTVRPVLDPARCDTVEGHDPPAWMRETVVLRDGHCVFPHCTRDARGCDLDHIDDYDAHGPPGQTSVTALACLCRRHHRAKTFHRWRYHRRRDGAYAWTSPHGRAYVVTPRGDTVAG